MQQSRRDFAKKAAVVTAGAALASGTAVMASGGNEANDASNGVVVGKSKYKEVTYRKTQVWENYYKHAL
ncbi:MAG: Tat pathway signal protein [Campylobacterota bacterium]